MNETNQPEKAKKKTMITIAILAVVVIIAIFVIIFVNQKTSEPEQKDPSTETPIVSEEEDQQEDVIENLVSEGSIPEALEEARRITPHTNYITKDNRVVTDKGEPVKMNVDIASDEAPKESKALSESQIPDDEYTVKLSVSKEGFEPERFSVSPGQLVNLVLTSTDDQVHIVKFEDDNLRGALLGVAPGETRMKSWNAPTTPGEYKFYCSVPFHERRGEVAMMIVE